MRSGFVIAAPGSCGIFSPWKCKLEAALQSAFLPAGFAFLHRALAIADSRALAAADIFRLGCCAGRTECFIPLILAHLALAAAAILALPARLILLFVREPAPLSACSEEPKMLAISF